MPPMLPMLLTTISMRRRTRMRQTLASELLGTERRVSPEVPPMKQMQSAEQTRGTVPMPLENELPLMLPGPLPTMHLR